ncbi:MULE transposase domain protein [Metarhizium robertsii]|uniref:MULE transposase domain protein n=1 Tax=Metarhizium robertsii TaxID=568076 RepID=A0A014PJC1_9HYPO|nr:MULE transposase domain protein [Metarhizium robertsii]
MSGRKRQRSTQHTRSSPSPSTSSSSTIIGQFYGLGDENALDNIFSSLPQTFSSLPRPHASQRLHELTWALRSDHEIYLQNDFSRERRRIQRVRALVPGPEPDPFASEPPESPPLPQQPPTRTKAEFESAMSIARHVIGEGRRLTIDLAQSYERVQAWRERWGWSPISSEAYDSPPPCSPPHTLPTQPLQASPTPQTVNLSPIRKSLSPAPEPIPNPVIPGDPAPSAEALFNTVNTFAKENGFGIVRRNQYAFKGRVIRYSFQCDRFGQPRASEGTGLRTRKSRKCGCQWKITAESLEEGKWLLRQHKDPKHHQHNHQPSITPSAHPSHRRLTTPVKATIESASRRVGIRASDVAAIVEEQFPDTTLLRKDIYNTRSLINREKLHGYTPTAALIKLFHEKNIPYLAKWADDDPDRLLGLVWTFPYCLQMWKRFPEVISFDNTYNTNRFKLPLFQATGQTCLKTVFNAAFGLIDNERREGFQFLAESIKELLTKHSINQPDVIITDFDKAMKAALDDQFPNVQQQLCIHHILSNVLLKSKTKWTGKRAGSTSTSPTTTDDEDATDKHLIKDSSTSDKIPHTYQGVVLMWKRVLYAETEKEFEQAWRDLCKEFDDQRAILEYLYSTYLPVSAQWARCFIRRYRNFGIRVTSGTEASNNNVKSYLLNGMSHLYRLVEAMQDMIHDQERAFMDACGQDDVLTAPQYLGSMGNYLGELRTNMSSKGLGLINKQYCIARKFMPTGKNPFPESIGPCDDDCTVSIELGIPCYHKVYAKLDSATPFTKWEVHPRWRLRESVSQDPYRRILDPKVATTLRGRPKNTAQAIPASLTITESSQAASQSGGKRRGRPPGRPNKSTDAKKAQKATQKTITQTSSQTGMLAHQQTSRPSTVLRSGKTTGVRCSGRRTQPNIRRTRSQWELAKSDEEDGDCIVVEQ